MRFTILLVVALLSSAAFGRDLAKPAGSYFEKFHPVAAPKTSGLILKENDRLAICGDSITEQKMYSRIMETYLTVCVPELNVTVRQFGWSGERAPGFLARMTNDCLRFQPTIATTCYGMNDHEYKPFEERIGKTYLKNQMEIVESFKAHGARVILGSAGCVGKMPGWVKSASGTVEDLNLNLCELRNIDIDLAQKENVRFADVFWPMLVAQAEVPSRWGTNYAVAGKDGVHPGWAGHTVMAYAFLKAMGLKGEIGTITVDLKANTAKVSKGHELIVTRDGEFEIRSDRYPFCATGPVDNDNSIRSGMALVPFNQDLNRLMLVAKRAQAAKYKVTWGGESKIYSRDELANGINLAADFAVNPFSESFKKVDEAVAAKQAYETKQIKQIFHGKEGKADMPAAVAATEAERAPLAAAIKSAFVPVTHIIKITPE